MPIITALTKQFIILAFQPASPCRHQQYERMCRISGIFQFVPACKSGNRDLGRFIFHMLCDDIFFKFRGCRKICHRRGRMHPKKIIYIFQVKYSVLKKIKFLFIDLSCDRVRHRFPDIGMVTSVRRNIQIRSQKIQNMAKT